MHRYQISSTTSIFRSKAVLIKNDYWIIKPVKSRSKTRFMPIGWRLNTSQNNHNVPPVSEPFLYLFSSKNGIFHKFLYRAFWYSRNYTYFYFPKWRYKPRMVLKITNLHILRYLPTCWLYLLECYTIDNQRCTHTASENKWDNTLTKYFGHFLFNTYLPTISTVFREIASWYPFQIKIRILSSH